MENSEYLIPVWSNPCNDECSEFEGIHGREIACKSKFIRIALLSSACQREGNAALTLSWGNLRHRDHEPALPNSRAKVSPNRRERKESTLSSRICWGRLAPLDISKITAVKVSDNRGEVKREQIEEGNLCRPVAVPPKDSGMYSNRDFAGGAVWGISATLCFSLLILGSSISSKHYYYKRNNPPVRVPTCHL